MASEPTRLDHRMQRNNFGSLEPVRSQGTITPDTVLAGQGYCFTLTLRTLEEDIPEGAVIAVTSPRFFGRHLGVPRTYGLHRLANLPRFGKGEDRAGYVIAVDLRGADTVEEWRVIEADVPAAGEPLYIEIVRGSIPAGKEIRIDLGSSLGSNMMAGHIAQWSPFQPAVIFPEQREKMGIGRKAARPLDTTLWVKVVGSVPEKLDVWAPSGIAVGEEGTVRVKVADRENWNQCYTYTGRVTFMPVEGLELPESCEVPEEAHGVIDVPVRATKEGNYRIVAYDASRGLMGRSNPMSTGAVRRGLRPYWGEFHVHTIICDGDGTPEDALRWGRDSLRLDWCGLGPHYVRYQDGYVPFETMEEYAANVAKAPRGDLWLDEWEYCKEVTRGFYEPGRFATILGYEQSAFNGYKDANIYFREDDGPLIHLRDVGGWGLGLAKNLLKVLEGLECILIPHHPGYYTGQFYEPRDDAHLRLIEIYSTWGDSISKDAGRVVRPSVRTAGLNTGCRWGFTGGTDNHSGMPATGNFRPWQGAGITAVWAPELTREAVFDGLWARHTVASTGPRSLVWLEVDGLMLGDERWVEDRDTLRGHTVAVDVEGAVPVVKVEVYRNGEVIREEEANGESVSLTFEDEDIDAPILVDAQDASIEFVYYYVCVTHDTGDLAWSSPIWFLHRRR